MIDDFGTGARFAAAVGEAGDALGHHPSVSIGKGYVDFKLVSDDAIYRDDEGTQHVVEWVTQQDVDLARRITEIAVDHKVDAGPASVSDIELGAVLCSTGGACSSLATAMRLQATRRTLQRWHRT